MGYKSTVRGPQQRRMFVYLPENYYADDTRYPVLYLLHGARGNELSWMEKGQLLDRIDSLKAIGAMEECIVVLPNVNQYDNEEDYGNGRCKNAFQSLFKVDGSTESAFMRDVVAFVDSVYRTRPEKGSRALAGLSIGGMLCLWSGVLEVMSRSGASDGLSRLLRPVLRRLFPRASRDRETLNALSANVSANLLGLGNAATPMGVKAAAGIVRLGEPAAGELGRLVVLNTASVQLLPTTIAAVRAAAGAASAFDILPAVWISSLASVTAGLLCQRLLLGKKP